MEQFLQKVNHLVHKRNSLPHQNTPIHQPKDALSKNKAKINKSSSITKMANYEEISSFGKMKTQQANSVYDENNSFMANVYGGMSRGELKKRLENRI